MSHKSIYKFWKPTDTVFYPQNLKYLFILTIEEKYIN